MLFAFEKTITVKSLPQRCLKVSAAAVLEEQTSLKRNSAWRSSITTLGHLLRVQVNKGRPASRVAYRLLCACSIVLSSGVSLAPCEEREIEAPEAQSNEQSKGDESASKVEVERSYSKETFSFGPYMGQFRAICNKLEKDGRREYFYKLVDKQARTPHPNCFTCRQLMKSLSYSCKRAEKRPTFKKSQDGEHGDAETSAAAPIQATPIPRQREPNLEALDIASQSFARMAERMAADNESIDAIKELLDLLRNKEDKTAAEISYFDILAEYMESPFRSLLKEHARIEEKRKSRSQATPRPAIDLNELF